MELWQVVKAAATRGVSSGSERFEGWGRGVVECTGVERRGGRVLSREVHSEWWTGVQQFGTGG